MLDTVCPGLTSQEGCFRTSRELPRHVGRLASPDKPAERLARDGAGWRRRRSGSDTDDARGGDRGAGLGGAEYGGDDGGGGAWTRGGSVGAGADSDGRSLRWTGTTSRAASLTCVHEGL